MGREDFLNKYVGVLKDTFRIGNEVVVHLLVVSDFRVIWKITHQTLLPTFQGGPLWIRKGVANSKSSDTSCHVSLCNVIQCCLMIILLLLLLQFSVVKLTYTNAEKKDTTPMLWYGACAFTYLSAMLASNKALQWVSYPTQVCKIVKLQFYIHSMGVAYLKYQVYGDNKNLFVCYLSTRYMIYKINKSILLDWFQVLGKSCKPIPGK